MKKLNLTSFGLRRKLSHYLKLKITVNILVVLYTIELVVAEIYVGETTKNAIARVDEHKQPNGKSEPSKHLKNNPGHRSERRTLSRKLSHRVKRKIIEAYFIKQLNPSLNDQFDREILIPFRHGLTKLYNRF